MSSTHFLPLKASFILSKSFSDLLTWSILFPIASSPHFNIRLHNTSTNYRYLPSTRNEIPHQNNEPKPSHIHPPKPSPAQPLRPPSRPPNTRIRLQLETYITSSIPLSVLSAFNTLLNAFKSCITTLYRLNAHRQDCFLALCPTENSYQFARHTNAVRTLLSWKEEYRQLNPMLCPSMKIPRFAMEGLCVSTVAYEAWTGRYNGRLERLRTVQFKEHIDSKEDFARAIESVRSRQPAGSGVEVYDLSELRRLEEEMLAEMGVWEPYVDMLGLPSYEALTLELYRGINACLDGDDVGRLMGEMRSRRGFWHW